MSRRTLKLFLILIPAIPILLAAALIVIVYYSQDKIVAESLRYVNESFEGSWKYLDSHIAPFANFPYISIDFGRCQVL